METGEPICSYVVTEHWGCCLLSQPSFVTLALPASLPIGFIGIEPEILFSQELNNTMTDISLECYGNMQIISQHSIHIREWLSFPSPPPKIMTFHCSLASLFDHDCRWVLRRPRKQYSHSEFTLILLSPVINSIPFQIAVLTYYRSFK